MQDFKDQKKVRKNKLTFIIALVSFIIYFFVAYFSNHGVSNKERYLSSFSHGLFCFFMTWTSSTLMQCFFNIPRKKIHKYLLSVFGAGTTVIICMSLLHIAIGTPEAVKTVLYSAFISGPYYMIFPLVLLLALEQVEGEERVKIISLPYSLKDNFNWLRYNTFPPKYERPKGTKCLEQKVTLNPLGSKVRVGFLGDLMPMYKRRLVINQEVINFFSDVDLLVANFEGTLFGSSFVFMSQNHNENILFDLKKAFPNKKIALSVANNHGADAGERKLEKTIMRLEELGFHCFGTKKRPSYFFGDDIEIVGVTEWSNQPHRYLPFLKDHMSFQDPSKKFHILFPHWCHEMSYYPNSFELERAAQMIDSWDMIIGAHSHLPGLVESRQGKLIAYSLGNSATALPRYRYLFGQALKVEIGESGEGKLCTGELQWRFTKVGRLENKRSELSLISAKEFFDTRA